MLPPWRPAPLAHAERATIKHPSPSLYKVPTYSTRAGAAPRAPGGARHRGGNRAMTSQPRTGQSTSYGDVKSLYGGAGRWDRRGCATGAPRSANRQGGRGNTDTQNAGATPGGTRASTADKEEGHREAGEATRTAERGGTGHLGLTETKRGRLWTACGQRRVDSKNSQTTPATTGTSSIRQLLGAADAQTAHHATFSTAPTHQILGSANAETTPARALAAAAGRKQQTDATCEGKNG